MIAARTFPDGQTPASWPGRFVVLVVFTPGFAMLGAFSTLDSRLPLWWGVTIGALVGLLFGMVFSHYRAQWLDYLFGQREREEED